MKVLLTIGHSTYLLPNDQGVSTLAKLLSKAREASRRYTNPDADGDYTQHIEVSGGAPEIKVRYLAADEKIVDLTQQLRLPEHGSRPD